MAPETHAADDIAAPRPRRAALAVLAAAPLAYDQATE
jgi:hypothetical protein